MSRAYPLLALALLAGACDTPDADAGIDREAFVATYVALRRATLEGRLDEPTRDSILEAHGTTEEELRAWLRAREDDPQSIAEAWREINETLSAPPDTAEADSAETASDN
jgi:hypothetical protein